MKTTTRTTFLRNLCIAALILAFPACSKSGDAASLKGRVTSSGPVGVFFMTRDWSGGPLEKAAWYFAADGTVYQNLENGVTPADLAAHKGPKGTYKLTGDQLEIAWAGKPATKSRFEPDKGGPGFAWDGGLFSPVGPITDLKIVAGKFEGGESLSHGGNSVMTSHTFVFRADGTYTREGVASVKGATSRSVLTGGATGGEAGTWKADGYTIILTGANGGAAGRKMAFPWSDDDKNPPNRLYLGGTLLKRQ